MREVEESSREVSFPVENNANNSGVYRGVERGLELEYVERAYTISANLIGGLGRVFRGKEYVLRLLVSAFFSGGHVLINDVPGLGKTTLAKTIAKLIAKSPKKGSPPVSFKRIQFTPDLLPYDITGVDIFDPESRRFKFSPGPVFASIVLADEINRTTPKVQSALLEVMAENQVTVGNKTHKMDSLFFVIATENPVEMEGTYPLPIAELDRFLIRIEIGYPDEDTEIGIVRDNPTKNVLPDVKPVCSKDDILFVRDNIENVYCDPRLIRAAVGIAIATRRHRAVELGVSPRGSLMLIGIARAFAVVNGRGYVLDQDIVELAPLVMAHRLKMRDLKYDPASLIRELALAEISKIGY